MGTQPTNAGIDFQQRVSAWMLINMVAEIDLANSIDVKDHTYIEKVACSFDMSVMGRLARLPVNEIEEKYLDTVSLKDRITQYNLLVYKLNKKIYN